MNLLQVRTWFIKESGRYDLVTDITSFANNGADNYLNAAQRMLDRMQQTPLSLGHNWQSAAVNVRHVVFTACRSIQRVFATKISDGTRTELEKKTLDYVKELHFDTDVATGTPLYFAPGVFRLTPEASMDIGSITVPANYLDYIGESPFLYNGVLFAPACDESYAIETWGYWYSEELSSDTDETFWTTQHPEILVMAGQLVLEKFSRNTEGVKDWLNAIKSELQGIDFDSVEEDIATVNQMEG